MEPQQNEVESVIAPLKKVTPLSKYLAMVLFIILPFLGGYVGYTLAPEQVIETGYQVVTNEQSGPLAVSEMPHVSESNALSQSEVDTGTGVADDQFLAVAPQRYVIPAGYFLEYDTLANDLYSSRAKEISDNLSLVQVASPQQPAGPIGTVLFDEVSNSVVRVVEFPINTMDVWVNKHTRIVLEWDEDYRNRLTIYDYIADTSEILYEEVEEGIQLVAVCEMGCTGVLQITEDKKLAFNRYEAKAGTSATKLIGSMTVDIPEKYTAE
jgi:hypothetical protein